VTLASLLARGGHEVVVLTRSTPEADEASQRRGIARLPELVLARSVEFRCQDTWQGDLAGLVAAVPAQSVRASIAGLLVARETPVLSAAKGIEHGTLLRMSEVLAEEGWPAPRVAVISGPNLAHEVARGLPAAAVVASSSAETATAWQHALSQGRSVATAPLM
jgi:glycerol-3-phosphate dehydrogenase (NAD(P)+)